MRTLITDSYFIYNLPFMLRRLSMRAIDPTKKVIAPLTLTICTTDNTCSKTFTILFQTGRFSAFASSSATMGFPGVAGYVAILAWKARGFFDFKLAAALLRMTSNSLVFWQSVQSHLTQYFSAEKQSQYNLRHLDFLHRRGAAFFLERPLSCW